MNANNKDAAFINTVTADANIYGSPDLQAIVALLNGILKMFGVDFNLSSFFNSASSESNNPKNDYSADNNSTDTSKTNIKAIKGKSDNLDDDFPEGVEITSSKITSQTSGGSPLKIEYYGENGEVVVKSRDTTKEATRAWINNNPGNLRAGVDGKLSASERRVYEREGAIGIDGDGHLIFASPEAGMRAMNIRLHRPLYFDKTISGAINTYAPSSDGNNPVKYAKQVAKAAGVSTDTPLKNLSDEQFEAMVEAMVIYEGYKQKNGAVSLNTAAANAQKRYYASNTEENSGADIAMKVTDSDLNSEQQVASISKNLSYAHATDPESAQASIKLTATFEQKSNATYEVDSPSATQSNEPTILPS